MPSTSVVSGRVESRVRLRAERLLRQKNLTANDAIRNTWRYIADTGNIPESALYSPEEEVGEGFLLLEKARAAMPQGTPLDIMTADDLKRELSNRG